MQEFDFHTPETLEELRKTFLKGNCGFIAGGTDLLPIWNRNNSLPHKSVWIDLTHISELRFINEEENHINIGALCTHNDLLESDVLKIYAPALIQAVATIGCVQTRNRGTLGGNLANASPAADCAPPLLTLEARVNIYGQQGIRQVKLESFFTHPGHSVLTEREIIHSISFNKPTGAWGSSFIKHGNRQGMAISVASAAAFINLNQDGLINKVRIAVGSLAPTPVRVISAEEAVLESNSFQENLKLRPNLILKEINPIDDLRATAFHRNQTGAVLISRVVKQAYVAAKGNLP